MHFSFTQRAYTHSRYTYVKRNLTWEAREINDIPCYVHTGRRKQQKWILIRVYTFIIELDEQSLLCAFEYTTENVNNFVVRQT